MGFTAVTVDMCEAPPTAPLSALRRSSASPGRAQCRLLMHRAIVSWRVPLGRRSRVGAGACAGHSSAPARESSAPTAYRILNFKQRGLERGVFGWF